MVTDREFSDLKRDHEDLTRKFEEFVDEQRLEDSRKLRTALIAAGAVILALGGFVWAEIIWPVIKLGR